ncbi:hypothetical protein L218DRAFT_951609 [Marasmius fiardii PR-910]|nr:hypothetical protein L218DRAFT_951609 [Marasmius fiardii PR-910]
MYWKVVLIALSLVFVFVYLKEILITLVLLYLLYNYWKPIIITLFLVLGFVFSLAAACANTEEDEDASVNTNQQGQSPGISTSPHIRYFHPSEGQSTIHKHAADPSPPPPLLPFTKQSNHCSIDQCSSAALFIWWEVCDDQLKVYGCFRERVASTQVGRNSSEEKGGKQFTSDCISYLLLATCYLLHSTLYISIIPSTRSITTAVAPWTNLPYHEESPSPMATHTTTSRSRTTNTSTSHPATSSNRPTVGFGSTAPRTVNAPSTSRITGTFRSQTRPSDGSQSNQGEDNTSQRGSNNTICSKAQRQSSHDSHSSLFGDNDNDN